MIVDWIYHLGLYARYLRDFNNFSRKNRKSRRGFQNSWSDKKPCLYDRTAATPFDAHYLYHPAWAARILAKTKPKRHVDISSILSFSTILSAFVPVDYYDFRPAKINLEGFKSGSADLTNLHFKSNSVESLSCMHVLEHLGLGRYGDAIDPDADLAATEELIRILKPGGNLLIVVPVGKPKIVYNAHRIYDTATFIGYFPTLKLKMMSVLMDDPTKGLTNNPKLTLVNQQRYACGCFWFVK